MAYQEEALLVISGLSGVGAASLLHWLSTILGWETADLADRLGRALNRDGEESPGLGLAVLLLGGAALGFLYGSLVHALGFSSPRAVIGVSALLGFLQALVLVTLLSQAHSERRVLQSARSGVMYPVFAEFCFHCCFGLCLGAVLSLFRMG